VADATSSNTTHAWPLCFKVLKARTSRIFPNWEKTAWRDFFNSARISANYSQPYHINDDIMIEQKTAKAELVQNL
jgi:hypothetical protein